MNKERTALKNGEQIPLLELYDSFDIPAYEEIPYEVYESASGLIVDGKIVLARCVGPVCILDGVSRNKRFYSKKLWERAFQQVQEKINAGMFFGTLGHNTPLSDEAMLEGKISHKIQRLWLDESKKVGMGEIFVLNTPAGQNLNTYLRSGFRFPVSTRGFGSFAGTKMGENDIVDPETYFLEGIDYVLAPGILQAVPQLVESSPIINTSRAESLNETHKKEGTIIMEKTEQLLETLAADKRYATDQLNEALKSNTQLTTAVDAQKGELVALKEKLTQYEELGPITAIQEVFAGTQQIVEDTKTQHSNLKLMAEKLARYEAIGTFEELEALLETSENTAEVFETLGSPEQVAKALESAYATLNIYKKLGKPQDIHAAFKMTEETLGQLKDVGTLDEINQLVGIVEEYMAFGSPQEIDAAFAVSEAFAVSIQEKYTGNKAKKLAKQYGVNESTVRKMLASVDGETLNEFLGEIGGTASHGSTSVAERYQIGTKPRVSRAQSMSENLTSQGGSRPDNRQRAAQRNGQRIEETMTADNRGSRLMNQFKLKNPIVVAHQGQ